MRAAAAMQNAGVVVLGVVGERAAVDRLVTGLCQVGDDRLLEFVAGVVAAKVDAHAGHCGRPIQREMLNRIGVPRYDCV